MAVNPLYPLPLSPSSQRRQMLADGTYQGSALQTQNANDNASANSGQTGRHAMLANGTYPGSAQQTANIADNASANSGPGIGANGLNQSAPVTQTTPTPRPLTQYQTLLQKRLSGQDPTVVNAQQQQDTNASLNNYQAMRTAQQTGAQGGLTQGGLQYQRGIDKAQGAAAEENLSGQDRVNALARSEGQDTMSMAHGADLEQNTKNSAFINSLPPKAQQALRAIDAQGGDVQAAYAGMIGPDGTLKTEFQDATPSATKLQGIKDDLQTIHPDWSPEQVQTEATKQLGKTYEQTQNPITEAQRTQTIQNLNGKQPGQVDWTQPENKDALDSLPDTQLAQFNNDNRGEDSWASANAGKWVKINGQPYKVVGPNTDWQKDAQGNKVKAANFLDKDGNPVTLGQDGKPVVGKYTASQTPSASRYSGKP